MLDVLDDGLINREFLIMASLWYSKQYSVVNDSSK